MTTSEATGQSSPSKSVQPQFTTNPYVGILAVFLGAGLATLNSRLLSIGLPDLRGALGISFDDASWLSTVLNMATMFSGVFVVFLNTFGVRVEFCCRLRDLCGYLPTAAVCAELPGDVGVSDRRRPGCFYS